MKLHRSSEFARKWNKTCVKHATYEIHINGTMVKKYKIDKIYGNKGPLGKKMELVFYKDYGEKVNKFKVMDELFQQNGCFYA